MPDRPEGQEHKKRGYIVPGPPQIPDPKRDGKDSKDGRGD